LSVVLYQFLRRRVVRQNLSRFISKAGFCSSGLLDCQLGPDWPCNDGFRFDDPQGRSPFSPNTGEPNPKKTIKGRQPEPLLLVPAVEDEQW
jgi:hypothetical protein